MTEYTPLDPSSAREMARRMFEELLAKADDAEIERMRTLLGAPRVEFRDGRVLGGGEQMKLSDVIEEFKKNMSRLQALDDRVGFTREEMTIHVQAAFLRASVQLFHRDDKAEFARTAKIAWNIVHGRGRAAI